LPATFFTLAVAAVIAPLSYWQHGWPGVCVVVAEAATIIVSFWLAAWLMRVLLDAGRMTAGVLAATGLRMVLPLALVLVMEAGQFVPASTVLYLVPLYLSMLCADTVLAARQPLKQPAGQG
jgi:hypothetical protein